jgi:hypothetical protein
MRKTLTTEECDVLNRIAMQTGMDGWFCIVENRNGHHYIDDLEEGKRYSLAWGIRMLDEGIVPSLLDLTDREIEVYENLIDELSCIRGY